MGADMQCPRCGYATATPDATSESSAAALCYSFGFVTGALFLLLAPYNRNQRIRFHAYQSIYFQASSIALVAAAWNLNRPISVAIAAAACLVWLVLVAKAWRGDRVNLPLIGALAQRSATPPPIRQS